ncbi:MAG: purine-nucleoside phosphorylase [Alphaproteobacteria bacterium]|nr:purine-nucleoside phosphorylase [Alphaproteobacteria bacterium]
MSHIIDPLDNPVIQDNAKRIRDFIGGADVKLAITLGSGVGPLAEALTDAKHLSYDELADFPRPTVSGHAGELIFGYLEKTPVLLLKGREHHYERGNVQAMKVPLRSLKAAGVETIMLTNAAGSLREEVGPGSVMMIVDHIFFSVNNPLTGEQGDNRFVDMSQAYDAAHSVELRKAAANSGVTLHEGVYMWFPGPNFETPAEIRAARVLGADAAGMSTAPEAIIARHCGMKVAGMSVITNLGAGMDATGLSHEQTVTVAARATEDIKKLITAFAQHFATQKVAA